MKYPTFIFLLLFALKVSAQDSVKISVNIQARDVKYITAVLPYAEEYEGAYDAAKARFRVANPPATNTTPVAIDSVTVGVWYKIWEVLQKDYIAVGANVASRIDALLRAKNNAWLTAKMDFFVSDATNYYNNLLKKGEDRLKKK